MAPPTGSADASDPIASRRCIHLGNLPYGSQPEDIEQFLTTNGFGDFETIHICIDTISARNPGYCFVDFPVRKRADDAVSSLRAGIGGRPITVSLCNHKYRRRLRASRDGFPTSCQWTEWRAGSGAGGVPTEKLNTRAKENSPGWALPPVGDLTPDHQGRRLWVGGLRRRFNPDQHGEDIARIFAGFKLTAIGKRKRSQHTYQHYCFVDCESQKEAKKAVNALNRKVFDGRSLEVALAKGAPRGLVDPCRQGGSGRDTEDRVPDVRGTEDRVPDGRDTEERVPDGRDTEDRVPDVRDTEDGVPGTPDSPPFDWDLD